MHHPTDRIAHTTAFVTPVVEHWLEREIAQWGNKSMLQGFFCCFLKGLSLCLFSVSFSGCFGFAIKLSLCSKIFFDDMA